MKILKSKKIGNSELNLVILHGLYGSSDSWRNIANELANNFTIHLLDLRNHGKSFWSDEHNYNVMTEDLKNYISSENVLKFNLLGHSMGGKLAINFTKKYPDLIDKLIIADIAPRCYYSQTNYNKHLKYHINILKLMQSIDLKKYSEYRQLTSLLASYDVKTKNIILKNISKKDNKFIWKINIKSIQNNLTEIINGVDDKSLYNKKIGVETMFLKAENSNYITKSDEQIISSIFNNYTLQTISNAGHWLHFDNHTDTTNAIKQFLI